jgi:hypothetical protein
MLMNRVQLLDPNTQKREILRTLATIYQFAPHDPRKRLFAAIKFYQLGALEQAKNLLQTNLDDNELVKLSTLVLGQVHVANQDSTSLEQLIDQMLAGDTYENYDVLYLVGEMPEKRLLEKIKDQILGITVVVDKDIIWDDLVMSMPIKWALAEPDKLKVTMTYEDQSYTSADYTVDKDTRTVQFSFGDMFDFKALENHHYNLEVSFTIDHPHHHLSLVGHLRKVTSEAEQGLVGKSYNSVKSWIVDSSNMKDKATKEEIVFQTDYLKTKRHQYVIGQDGEMTVLALKEQVAKHGR